MSLADRIESLRDHWHRMVENCQMRHVPRRCAPTGCTCPCGYCKHDRRHVPGTTEVAP